MAYFLNSLKTWDFPEKKHPTKRQPKSRRTETAASMELEQGHIMKFLYPKGLKLDDIAPELSNLDGHNACIKLSAKHSLHQLNLGRKDLTTQDVGGTSLDDTGVDILPVLRRSLFSWT
jgi:hypothetical protein